MVLFTGVGNNEKGQGSLQWDRQLERSVSRSSGSSEEEHRSPDLMSYLTLGKSSNLSLPLFPHLENEGNNARLIGYSPQSKETYSGAVHTAAPVQ